MQTQRSTSLAPPPAAITKSETHRSGASAQPPSRLFCDVLADLQRPDRRPALRLGGGDETGEDLSAERSADHQPLAPEQSPSDPPENAAVAPLPSDSNALAAASQVQPTNSTVDGAAMFQSAMPMAGQQQLGMLTMMAELQAMPLMRSVQILRTSRSTGLQMRVEAPGDRRSWDVRVSLRDGRIVAKLGVNDPASLGSLREQLPQLEQSLRARGIDVEQLSVGLDNGTQMEGQREGKGGAGHPAIEPEVAERSNPRQTVIQDSEIMATRTIHGGTDYVA